MGYIIDIDTFQKKSGIMKPLIFCYKDSLLESQAVSINVPLAKELINIKDNRRTIKIESILNKLICEMPDGVTIRDFDILFHPDYKIDLLSLFCSISKRKDFNIIWNGKLSNRVLTYAEPEYKDFHSYCIDDYDVTCVTKEI